MEAKTLLLVIAAIAVIVLVVMLIFQKNKVSAALESVEKTKKHLMKEKKYLKKRQKLKPSKNYKMTEMHLMRKKGNAGRN